MTISAGAGTPNIRQLHKFGGSSLADARCYQRVAGIMADYSQPGDLMVVSAAGSNINQLISWLKLSQTDRLSAHQVQQSLRRYQSELIAGLLPADVADGLISAFTHDLERLAALLDSGITDAVYAEVVGHGEVWSARLMAAVLQHLGVEAAWLDARDFLRAERAAQPQVDEGLSYPLLQQLLVQHPGKRIVVTGAARGLGYHFAEACAAQGATVVMCDILQGELAESAHRLQRKGYQVESHAIDLASQASIEQVFSAIGAQGSIDGLVNNAAMATGVGGKNMIDYDPDLWDRVMTVNVKGTWLVTRAAVPLLREGAAIVNVASDTALWGAPRLMAYVASKGAVIAMTRSMARELGEKRIRINAIAPGLTRVEATEYVPAERHQLYENGRALSGAQQPEDVTGSVVWLLSDLSRFITGQLIPVNGGFVFN